MNAQQLYAKDKDGSFKPQDIWFCGKCKMFNVPLTIQSMKASKENAEKCCQPVICNDCGETKARKGFLDCYDCHDKKWQEQQRKKTRERIKKAEKITDLSGVDYLFDDYTDKYIDVDELDDQEDTSNHLFVCKKRYFHAPSIRDAVENVLCDDFVGEYGDDLIQISSEEYDNAQKFLDKWAEDINQFCYFPDYSKVYLVDEKEEQDDA